MSHQDESSVSEEDETRESLIGFQKVSGNSAVEAEDSTEDAAYSDKEAFDNSSDDYHKKRDKKSGKQSKSKVKIKTLTIDGQLVYFCKICDKVFTRRKDKLNHELAHSGESVLTCTECGKEYLHESSLASHMRTHAGDPLFMCDLCPKMFAQSHHLKSHILSHSEPTNFVCKTCYKEFPTSSDLNHHIRIQSKLEITNYWCKMCKVYFCRSHKLTCDTRLHAFCCSACNELFHTHKKLKIHMKKFAHYSLDKPKYIEPLQEHELYPDKVPENLKKLQFQKENDLTRKPIKNDVSGKRQSGTYSDVPFKKFKLSVRKLIIDGDQSSTSLQDSATEACKELEIELKSPTRHRKGKPYCKRCNKSFKDSIDLDRHKASVHEDKQNSFTCELCSMGFTSKDDLERHGFKHSGERMHTCPVCGQEFPDSSQLTQHLRIHIGDFPYKCSQCGKAFKLKIQLIQHVRLHIAQDASSADKCPRVASVADEPQEHHSQGEAESLQCHLCSKTFCFQYKLLNHLRLHTNVKCFQCYICHKMFATKCYLQRHLQTHVKQGMDVDVQNIIVDGDSKSELDGVREQVIRENCQTIDSIPNHSIEGAEKEALKRPFLVVKRSVSNFELESRAKDNYNSNLDKNVHEVQGHSLSNIRSGDIKVEVEDDIDSFSEHSFSSSFTRDSERSDPFKFSSDESYTFKTVMAKERRRLRRRWKRNRDFFIQPDLQDMSELKKKDLNSDIVGTETGEDGDDDVSDMMVELNAVRSEFDDVTTVFVSLTDKKKISCEKTVPSSVIETPSVNDSSSLPKIELNVKKEIEHDYECDELGVTESTLKDIINTHENADQAKSSGKMLMFEFDAERLLDGHVKYYNEGSADMTSAKQTDEKNEIGEEAKMNTCKVEQVQRAESTVSLSQSLLPSNQKSHLKFIVADMHLKSETSNLEKLQAVFEHSSKYLPLPHAPSSSKISTPAHQNETQMSTKENESELNILMHSHSMSSCDFLLQEKQKTFVTQETSDGKDTMLPLMTSQNNTFIDKMTQQVEAQFMNSDLDLKARSFHDAKILEESSKSSLATSETRRSESSRKTSAKKIPKENSASSYSAKNARDSVTGFKTCPDANSHNISTLMMSKPIGVANCTSGTPQSSSFSISTATAHPSHYSIFKLTSQPSGHTSSNFTSQSSGHSSANLKVASSSHTISSHMVQSAGHGSSSLTVQPSCHSSSNFMSQPSDHSSSSLTVQPSCHSSSNFMSQPSDHSSASLTVQPSCHSSSNFMSQPSDHFSTNLMMQAVDGSSNLTVQPSSHSISTLISQSPGHTSSTSVVQPGHSSSTSMILPSHANSTPMLHPDHANSTPMLHPDHANSTFMIPPDHLSSTALVQPGHVSSTPMVQPGPASSTPMVQPGLISSSMITQSLSDTNSNLSLQFSYHPTSTVDVPPANHSISSLTAQTSSHKKLNAPAHISSHRTTVTSQSLTHKSSSLIPQQTSHSNSCLNAPPPASLANPLYYNSVIGTSSSEISYFQPGVNLSSSSGLSMKLNPLLNSIATKGTRSDNITVNSGYVANQNNPSGLLGNCFLSANHLVNQPCAIGLNTPANPSFSLAVNQDCFSLNPSTIFDASNPVYRDMNMMDLISTSSTDFSQPVAATNLGFMRQGGLETQMRHDIAPSLGLQSGILQSQNPLLNIGNPTLGTSFGTSGNPVSNLLHQRIVPVGYGQLDSHIFTTGPVGFGGGDGTFLNTGNVYSTLPRDVRLSSSSIPHFSMQLGHPGGPIPMEIANILSLNTGGFTDMGSLRTGNISGPVSVNIADFGGSSIISTGNLPLNQASFNSDFPLSIPTNPYMMNNLSSVGIFPNSGLQNNVSNLIASSNINFLNPTLIPHNTGLLPGSSTGFINDFSTGFFPKF